MAELCQFRNIGTAARGAARRGFSRDQSDLTPVNARNPVREIGDRHFFHGADVIDAEVLTLLAHDHDAGNEVVDEAEAARLLPGALDLEPKRPGGLRLGG